MVVSRPTSVAGFCLAVLLGVVGAWLRVADDGTPEDAPVTVRTASENHRVIVPAYRSGQKPACVGSRPRRRSPASSGRARSNRWPSTS